MTMVAVPATVIRVMQPADRDVVFEMARHFLAETPYSDVVPSDDEVLFRLFDQVMENPERPYLGRGFLAERDGRPVGMLGALVFDHPMMGTRIGSETVWWVEPEARGTSTGVKLLQAAMAWAQEQGAVAFQMMGWRHGRLHQLYLSLGFRETETLYLKTLV